MLMMSSIASCTIFHNLLSEMMKQGLLILCALLCMQGAYGLPRSSVHHGKRIYTGIYMHATLKIKSS